VTAVHGRLAVEVAVGDHAQGPPDATYVLVQYGDYECPYTRRSLRDVDAVRKELGSALRWVFRNFPLTEIHPHALGAAEAAEAAGAQGRFWEMHATLFAHQRALEADDLLRYGAQIGLDPERFSADLDGRMHVEHIQADFDGGVRSGVRGTPTFFTNGIRHDGDYSARALLAALRGETV
jgi:protein-disulfide isomerase